MKDFISLWIFSMKIMVIEYFHKRIFVRAFGLSNSYKFFSLSSIFISFAKDMLLIIELNMQKSVLNDLKLPDNQISN